MIPYVAIIRQAKHGNFSVEFPDFPGCISAGHTILDALEMAKEALSGHISVMAEYGDPIPSPSSLKEILTCPEYSGTTSAYVLVSK